MTRYTFRALKLLVTGLLLLVVGGLLYFTLMRLLPDQVNPMKPLHLDQPPGFLTKTKINRLKGNGEACFAVLENSDIVYQRVADKSTGEQCGFKSVAMLIKSNISYGGDIVLKCPALVALMIWERHDLQPLARQMFKQSIGRIRHYGTYACRNINNSKQGRRSQHAHANAIDIAGFVLADGQEISVLNDWGKATEKGEFLKKVHRLACDKFSTVLGPDYNNAHRNHFHFDQGGWSLCR